MTTKTKSNLQGFTLVEILVVSGIVAMLATLLFAVSARIRENGRKSVCQSNLKQLTMAFQQYVQDNESEYPTWREFIDGFIPHAKNKQVSYCPSQNQSNSSVYSYAYNSERLNQRVSVKPYVWVGRKESNLPQAATIWLLSDNSESSNYVPIDSSCGRREIGLKWHFEGANYSFLDGHVKWLTPKALGEIECSNPPLNPCGP